MLVKTSTGILWPRLRKSTSFDFGAIPRISHWGPLISTSLFKFPSTVTVNPIRIPDTPIRKKRSGASVLVPGATKAQMEFARETHGYWVGPFPILDFLDTVLPSSTQYSTPLPTIFKDIPSNTQEKDMYPKLVNLGHPGSSFILFHCLPDFRPQLLESGEPTIHQHQCKCRRQGSLLQEMEARYLHLLF